MSRSQVARQLVGRLTLLASSVDVQVKYRSAELLPQGALGFYTPRSRRIVLAVGLTVEHRAMALAHELAHCLLDHRTGDGLNPVAREAEAAATAYLVCAHFGIHLDGWDDSDVASEDHLETTSFADLQRSAERVRLLVEDMLRRMESMPPCDGRATVMAGSIRTRALDLALTSIWAPAGAAFGLFIRAGGGGAVPPQLDVYAGAVAGLFYAVPAFWLGLRGDGEEAQSLAMDAFRVFLCWCAAGGGVALVNWVVAR